MDLLRDSRRSTRSTASNSRRTQRVPAVRTLGLALAVVLLASLLAPLAPPVAAQDDDPIATDEATPALQADDEPDTPDQSGQGDGGDSDGQETPVAEETPATETPVVAETPDADLTANQAGSGNRYVHFFVMECASDYGGDLQQLRANCRIADKIDVELYGEGVLLQVDDGYLQAELSADDRYAIRELVPPGYGEPIAFCGVFPAGTAASPPLSPVVLNDATYEFALGADELIWCEWYNVRTDTISASMLSRFCTPDIDASLLGYGNFAANCLGEKDGVRFSVYQGGATVRQDTTSGSPSRVVWSDLPGSGLSFEMEAQAGYGQAIVYCNLTDPEGSQSGYQHVATLSDDGETYNFELTLLPGESVACDWFHIPAAGRLTIYKYVCPEDAAFDYAAADGDTLYDRCPAYEGDEALFDLFSYVSGETTTERTLPADSDGGGTVGAYWGAVPPGKVTVTEHAWEGYGTPKVFCGVAGVGSFEYIDVAVDDWRADFEIPSDLAVLCFWFDIPEGGEIDIYVTKHACPADIDASTSDLPTLGDKCPGMEGVKFVVYDKDAKELDSGLTEGDLGQVAFEDLPAGQVYVVEEYPEGYGSTPVVFCRMGVLDGQQTDYHRESVVSGDGGHGINKTIPGGEFLACEWFNIPEHGDVYIYKSFCPEDDDFDYYSATDVDSFAEDRCEHYLGDEVAFDLYSHASGETETKYTAVDPNNGGDVDASWHNVPAGKVTVTEHAQEGYGRPVVFCRIEGEGAFEAVEVHDRSARFELPSGKIVECIWFNIPELGGSVTVVKYTCPEGAGYGQGGFEWYEDACTDAAAGVAFKLDGESTGNPGEQTTGADGVVFWGEREADRYYLAEDVPAGYGTPVVFCDTYYPLDEEEPEYSGYAVSGEARIEFGLSEGQSIVCYWFNVPYDQDDPGTITVVKYRCEGDYVSELNCGLYGGGQKFTLTPAAGGATVALTTGPNGTASVKLPAGMWELDEVGAEWCLAESDGADAAGYLVVRAGYETVVTVYNCATTPGGTPPGQKPPTQLPNTGSGDAAEALTLAGPTGEVGIGAREFLLAAPILVLAGLAALRTRHKRRRAEELLAA